MHGSDAEAGGTHSGDLEHYGTYQFTHRARTVLGLPLRRTFGRASSSEDVNAGAPGERLTNSQKYSKSLTKPIRL